MKSAAACLVLPAGALAWLLVLGPSGGGEPAPPAGEKAFGDRYAVLIERNIFSRNRPQRYVPAGQPPRERTEMKAAPPPPEESLALTGVVRQEGVYTAFIEDLRTGSTIKARVGDAVARGKISGMSLDGLTYELEGKSAALGIGKTLAGGASSPSRAPGAAKASGEKAAAEASPSGAATDVLERLRQRRAQEMKK